MNPELLLNHFDRISDAPDAIPRLRRFVLDLAVRGKLVEQDPSDEPASEVLIRIQLEKARLVKEGVVKKLESFEPVGANEILFPVPTRWEAVRMGWLARKLGAGSTPLGGKSVYQRQGVPFLRSQNVHDDGLRLDEVALISRATHDRMCGTHIQQQDILLNITGASIGRCALVPDTFVEGNVSQHVAIIRLFLPAIREFIHLSLISPFFQKVIDDVQVGVSREGLSMQRLRLFPMLLPPLPEQNRIVARVNELMALCDRLEVQRTERESRRNRLTAASHYHLNVEDAKVLRRHADFFIQHIPPLTVRPDQIRQLRQTILSLAVRGKLVSQDPNDEPASELLKRIRIEEQRLVDDGKIKKQKPHAVLSKHDTPFCLPLQWEWVRLSTIADVQDPNPSHRMPQYVQSGGIPFISSENFVEGDQINFQIGKRVTQKTLDEQIARFSILAGALAFTRIGTIGKSRFLPAERTYGISHAVCVLNPLDRSALSMPFLRATLGAEAILAFAHRGTRSIGVPDLGMAVVRGMAIPLPPIAEQHRIVARVAELMSLCDRLEAQLSNARSESRRLLDAVLHNALSDTSSARSSPSRNVTPNMLEVFEQASLILKEQP